MVAPAITNLAGGVTFAENLVNATPQIIDADVTFADADGDFTGATLTVTGLLGDDRVAIQHVGVAAGQVGIAGATVSFGGLAIGAWSGGSGTAFSITFNAAATSAAIEAVIERLTYADVSDTPAASRTLQLRFTDAAGETTGDLGVDITVTAENDAPQGRISQFGLVGAEFLVNTATAGAQSVSRVVTLTDGSFVVVWQDSSAGLAGAPGDTNGTAVKAQLFAAGGTPIGAEILVNTAIVGAQQTPGVSAVAGGGFVVVWADASAGVGGAGGDTAGFAVKGQLYGAGGVPTGTEFLINTATAGSQALPQVATLAGGGFIVTWADTSAGVGGAAGDASGQAVKAQLFTAAGVPVGNEILVNTAVANSQNGAQIIALAGGGFVVIWSDASLGVLGAGGDTSVSAVKAQVFAAGGAKVGTEILVNTATFGAQFGQQITALGNGGFVVTWTDASGVGDTSPNGIKAQVFAAGGARVGTEITVNTATSGSQTGPLITTLSGGGFVIAWTDDSLGVGGAGGDTDSSATKVQIFADDGSRVGGEIRANTNIVGAQAATRIATLTNGGFVVSWTDSSGGSGGATGDNALGSVKAQVFTATGVAIGGEILANTAINSSQGSQQLAALPGGGFVLAWNDSSSGTGGATRDVTGTAVKAQVFGTTYGAGFATAEQVALNLKGQLFVADPDGADAAVSVRLSVASGILDIVAGTSGVSIADNGTVQVTLTGTIAQINALFSTDATSTVAFTPTGDAPPSGITLTMLVTDGAGIAFATQVITIVPVNDAPSGTDATRTIEDTGDVLIPADFLFTDPEGHGQLSVTIVTLPTLGTLSYDADGAGPGAAVAVTAGQTFIPADISDGRIRYQPGPNAVGPGYASLTFSIRDNGGVLNGGVDTDPTPATLTFNVRPGEDPGALTGLVGSITVSEAIANGRPFRIDTDVTYVELDSLTGGTLVLTGLFPEDRAGVFNLGNAAGQIGVSGTTVSYGGVAFGTISGGVGTTLTVTFNAAATAAAVDALIENLTYANASDTPTASRTLSLNIVDAGGGTLPKVASFAPVTGAANPLNGIDVGFESRVAFLDVDRDGDLDLVVGQGASGLRYFRNNGVGVAYSEVTGGGNPFSLFTPNSINFAYTHPVAADYDGDGDLDLIVGLDGDAGTPTNGQIRYFRNDGAFNFAEQTGTSNPFNGIDVGQGAAPGFVDIDGDGDLDTIVGERGGTILAFRNNGAGVAVTQLTGAANPFDAITSGNGSYPVPTFIDLDGDGDLDAIIGRFDGILVSYRNNGPNTAFTVMTPNPTAGLAVGQRNAPSAGDVDGDGDIDLLVGNNDGIFTLLVNTPNPFVGITINVLTQNDAPMLAGLATSLTFAENLLNATPQLIDADVTFFDPESNFTNSRLQISGIVVDDVIGIRDQGNAAGEIGFNGTVVSYGGVAIGAIVGVSEPGLAVQFNAAATSAAVDAVIQNLTFANISNTPIATRTLILRFSDADRATFNGPVEWQFVVSSQDPYFGNFAPTNTPILAYLDIDLDGDLDPIAGLTDGTFVALEATIRLADNQTVYVTTGAFNPMAGIDVGDNAAPAAFDLDSDGDLDLIVGTADGTLRAYRNTGAADTPFVALTGTANPFNGIDVGTRAAPSFVDLDGDGDLDAVIGTGEGTLLAFRNNGPGAPFTALTGPANPFDGISAGSNAVPAFLDRDNDGDLDALVGNNEGTIHVYTNNGVGSAFTRLTGTFFDRVNHFGDVAPSIVDFSRDSVPDVTVGRPFGGSPTVLRGLIDGSRSIVVTVTAEPEIPTLTGVATAVTFAESAVNFAPRLLDADVTFTQDGGIYTGAAVTVSGLLAEDRVTVLGQGNAAGQIGVNGTTVSYGSVVIGTIAGGIGATLTITLNAAATATAVDALIQRLGFADASNTPTANRTLTIGVTDNLGQQVSAGIDVTVTPTNDAPTLAGLTPSITYGENAAPLVIDSAVVLADAENVFAGGTLSVSGLLAEDRVSVLHQGVDPGQIGVAGNDVSYGGVIIGTLAGGLGATLLVTLNAAATTVAVDALLQSLTYANASDAPVASRSLMIDVTDAGGASLVGATSFTQLTGAANPFSGITLSTNAHAGFIDLDGDGDLDVVFGGSNAQLVAYRNNGAGTAFTAMPEATALFPVPPGFPTANSKPTFYDYDSDGDRDAVVGLQDGTFRLYRNNGTGAAFTEVIGAANPFAGIDAGDAVAPRFIDVTGDGVPDLVVGTQLSKLRAYANTGGVFTELTGAANPFAGFNSQVSSGFAKIDFADLDGDGDLDGLVTQFDAYRVLRNDGPGVFTLLPASASPFPSVPPSFSMASFIDLDGDGDLDTILGRGDGAIDSFLNTPAAGQRVTVAVTATNDRPTVAVSATTLNYIENGAPIVIDAGVAIGDPDSATLRIVAVTLGGSTTATDVLAFANTDAGVYGNIVGAYDVGTRQLSLTSAGNTATVAQFQAAARAITYASTSNAPVTGTITLNYFVQDPGFASALGGASVRNLLITAVNDAPTGTDATRVMLENGSRTLLVGDFGFADATDGAGANALLAVRITTLPLAGVLALNGVAVTAGQDVTAVDIVAGRLVFTPATNADGAGYASFTFQVQDTGGTANSGVDLDQSPNTLTFDVTPGNAAPSVTDPAFDLVAEDAANPAGLSVAARFAGHFTDPDNAAETINGIAIVANTADPATAGAWQYSTDGGSNWFAVGSVSGAAALVLDDTAQLRFVPAANYNGVPPGLRAHGLDASFAGGFSAGATRVTLDTAVTGGATAISPTAATIGVVVDAINDAPVNTLPVGPIAAVEDTALAITGLAIADVDLNGAPITIILSVASGTITVLEDFLLGDITGNGTASVTIRCQPTLINQTFAALGGVIYMPAANATGAVTLTMTSNDGGANGNDPGGPAPDSEQDVDTVTIMLAPVDDAPVAVADNATVPGNVTASIGVLVNDTDVDGGVKIVSSVNGTAIVEGGSVVLSSGARMTLTAGQLVYDPNGRFDALVSAVTAAATGAVNFQATDSFGYTLNGGLSTTVTVTITGVDGAGDQLSGDGTANTINGTPGNDMIRLIDGGTETAHGLGGSDAFLLGATLDPSDTIDGGSGADDQLAIQGNYTAYVFGVANMIDIETLSILSGTDARFGDTANNRYSYDLTLTDANIAPGAKLIVNANNLQATEDLTLDAHAETSGYLFVFGGFGIDTLTGGQGSDAFYFGEGGRFTAADRVDGRGGSDDQLGLRGNYTVTFLPSTMTGIETLSLLSAADTRFGDAAAPYRYDITIDDANIAAGQQLIVNANNLRSGESVTFSAAAETDGTIRFIGGAGADTAIGGHGGDVLYGANGADTMTGGDGDDVFLYLAATNSTTAARDRILDFTVGDRIDLGGIDAIVGTPANDAFSFIGGNAFGHIAGELRVTASGDHWLVEGDTDGDGAADLAILVTTTGSHALAAIDLIL